MTAFEEVGAATLVRAEAAANRLDGALFARAVARAELLTARCRGVPS